MPDSRELMVCHWPSEPKINPVIASRSETFNEDPLPFLEKISCETLELVRLKNEQIVFRHTIVSYSMFR